MSGQRRRGEGAAEAEPNRETGPEAGLEERLRRLEEIVAALEADDLDLERALALFEEGVAHVRTAEKILAETELKVEELLQGDRTRPLEGAEE